MNNYGSGAPCGGVIINHNSNMMRSSGGLAVMDDELNLLPVSIETFSNGRFIILKKSMDIFGSL